MHTNADEILNPANISLNVKQSYLLSMSEDEFRDKVVRPLMLRMGFKDGRDLCGPTEEGKDAVFSLSNPFGRTELWAVQTKKGRITMSSKTSDNIISIVTQLQTALKTKVYSSTTGQEAFPNRILLCASGAINDRARKHILSEIKDSRLDFIDCDDIIPKIDEHFPELWWGINANTISYLRNLEKDLLYRNEGLTVLQGGGELINYSPISEQFYIPLYVYKLRADRGFGKGVDYEEFEVGSLINRPEKLVAIVGDAGAGKTTALRRIAYKCSKQALQQKPDEMTIPVLLRARAIASDGSTLVNLIQSNAMEVAGDCRAVISMDNLQRGGVVVLVDGLDEIGSVEGRRRALLEIKEFHEKYARCRVILAARPYETITSLLTEFGIRHYQIGELDTKRVQSIIDKHLVRQSTDPGHAKEMMRQLQEIHGFSMSPLLVTVFVATADLKRKDIPANITELVKKYTELLLGRWDVSKGLDQQYQVPVKDFLLQVVALQMHRRRDQQMALDQFNNTLKANLTERGLEADLDSIASELLQRSHLVYVENDEVRFRHHMLQEFFAGRAMRDLADLAQTCGDDWWRNPIVFYFGDNPSNEAMLADLVRAAGSATGLARYNSAIAVGLATQASYLAKNPHKEDALFWTLEALVQCYAEMDEIIPTGVSDYPLNKFLFYYMGARDAVASPLINKVFRRAVADERHESDNEVATFWSIVGMIEAGQLLEAKEVVWRYVPKDQRLLLAIYIGCRLIVALRQYTKEQKRLAQEIHNRIGPKITHLRDQFLGEFRSLLIEMRKGKLTPIEEGGDRVVEIEAEAPQVESQDRG